MWTFSKKQGNKKKKQKKKTRNNDVRHRSFPVSPPPGNYPSNVIRVWCCSIVKVAILLFTHQKLHHRLAPNDNDDMSAIPFADSLKTKVTTTTNWEKKKNQINSMEGRRLRLDALYPTHIYTYPSIKKNHLETETPPAHMKSSAGKVRERTALHYIDDVPCVPLAGFCSKNKRSKMFFVFPFISYQIFFFPPFLMSDFLSFSSSDFSDHFHVSSTVVGP